VPHKSEFNISVYPGKASYSNFDGSVTGVFGDGTVLGYRFFNSDGTVLSSYADDGSGIVAPVVSPPDVDVGGSESWANVWTTTDPGVDFANAADITEDTLTRSRNITGTIDISSLSSGTVYVIFGANRNWATVTLTMSGAGQTDIQAEYYIDPPNDKNRMWVSSFDFSDAEGYETITYAYTYANADRCRFMGVIIDGFASTAMNHNPANGETVDTANPLTLSWTNIDPNGLPLFVDVWFGTEPNEASAGYDMEPVVDHIEDTTFVDVDASAVGTYYWRIDVTIGDANTIKGKLLSFTTTDDPAPTVEIHTPAMMTWSDNPVTLDATITDSGSSLLTYGWTAVPDGIGDPNITVDFDAGAEDPEVTVTNLTGSMVTVTMILTAFDDANPDEIAEASVEIDVYPDACEMAKNGLGTPVPVTDFNADCITDLLDFAEMASAWLDDYAATEAVDR